MTTKLLAVDDSKTMRQVLEHTFAGEAFETCTVSGVAEALDTLSAGGFNVALVDVSLPGSDGYDACRAIREKSPDTRVLMLSSKHHPYDEARGLGAGASGNIDKPFDTQTMIERVAALSDEQPAPVMAATAAASAPPLPIAPVGETTFDAFDDADLEEVEVDELEISDEHAEPADAFTLDDSVPPSAPRALASSAPPKPSAADLGAPAVRAPSNGGDLSAKLTGLGLTAEQASAVMALTKEVVEQAVWEVVPVLAETLIKEEIKRLTSD